MINKLKLCRIELGLSQTEVANNLGIATSTYSGWESEPDKIKIVNAKKLSALYGKSLDYLFLN